MNIKTLDDVETKGKTVLLRVDFNSPVDPVTKKITDITRIKRHVETIKDLEDSKLVILAHQGRPGDLDFITLEQHAKILSGIVPQEVQYIPDIFGPAAKDKIKDLKEGEVLLLENTRFFAEEILNRPAEVQKDTALVKNLAPLADLYVNDAFAAAHRSQPSIVGFPMVLPSVAGRLMQKELEVLGAVMKGDEKPEIFVIGGAKFKDAVELIKYVLENDIADQVLLTGIVGNLFLLGRGVDLGESKNLIEQSAPSGLMDEVRRLIQDHGRRIETPVDVAVNVDGERVEHTLNRLPDDHQILDIGEGTIAIVCREIRNAGTVVANGPPGKFEDSKFEYGTKKILQAIAETSGRSVIGGGHIVAEAVKYGLDDKIDYISTGGGAMIQLLSGKELPAIRALEFRGKV
ncbi:MAG: phosphoglycerate kinase [Methanosarcinales archaeon]